MQDEVLGLIAMSDSVEGRQDPDRLEGVRSWRPSGMLLDALSQNEGPSRSVEDVIATVTACSQLWDLIIHPPFPGATQNFVAPADSAKHGETVLKVGFNGFMFERECRALRLFDGSGAVKVLEWDSSLGAMLLERVDPGSPMNLDWDAQTEEFCGLLKSIWKPAKDPTGLPEVTSEGLARLRDLERMHALFATHGDTSRCETITHAIETLQGLISTAEERFVVHGDLHPENILASHRARWLSIDPIGCVGERAFDACTLFREENRALRSASNPRDLIERRLRTLSSECNLDEGRLRAWSFVEAVRIQGWLYGVGMPTDFWSLLIPVLET